MAVPLRHAGCPGVGSDSTQRLHCCHEEMKARAPAEGRSVNALVNELLSSVLASGNERAAVRARARAAGLVVAPRPTKRPPSRHAAIALTKGAGRAASRALARERSSADSPLRRLQCDPPVPTQTFSHRDGAAPTATSRRARRSGGARDPRRSACVRGGVYTSSPGYIVVLMAKHLVDIDDDALNAARAELGTESIKDTVNQALRRAARERPKVVRKSLDVLGRVELDRREDAWR